MINIWAPQAQVGVTFHKQLKRVVGAPHIVGSGPVACGEGLQGGYEGRECHAKVEIVYDIKKGVYAHLTWGEMCISRILPHCVVVVEISHKDDVSAIRDVVIREGIV